MTLETVISEIAEDLQDIEGLRGAPSEPPEQINVFPFVVIYVRGGVWQIGAPGVIRGLHDIVVELHVARRDLPRDVRAAMSYAESVPQILLGALSAKGDRFNGSISTFGRLSYTFGPMQWGGVDTVGFRWVLENVKTETAL